MNKRWTLDIVHVIQVQMMALCLKGIRYLLNIIVKRWPLSLADDNFRSRVSVFLDIYPILASGIRLLQTVHQMPWEVMNDFETPPSKLQLQRGWEKRSQRVTPTASSVKQADKADLWPTLTKHQRVSDEVVSCVCYKRETFI